MDQNFVDTVRFSTWKNRLAFNLVMPAFVILLLILGWVVANEQASSLTRAIIPGYQKAELEIVRVAARSINLYLQDQVDFHNVSDLTTIEQNIFKLFIKPIKLLKSGDAWIYAPSHVVFDLSEDFPNEYRGKSMDQIFDIQKKKVPVILKRCPRRLAIPGKVWAGISGYRKREKKLLPGPLLK